MQNRGSSSSSISQQPYRRHAGPLLHQQQQQQQQRGGSTQTSRQHSSGSAQLMPLPTPAAAASQQRQQQQQAAHAAVAGQAERAPPLSLVSTADACQWPQAASGARNLPGRGCAETCNLQWGERESYQCPGMAQHKKMCEFSILSTCRAHSRLVAPALPTSLPLTH